MIGKSPDLPLNAAVNDQVQMQFDFRQIYSSIMQDWLCMSEAQATEVLGNSFAKIPIFNTNPLDTNPIEGSSFMTIYPNPTIDHVVNIRFGESLKGSINLKLYSMQGSLVYKNPFSVDGTFLTVTLDNALATGIYILQVEYNNSKHNTKLIIS